MHRPLPTKRTLAFVLAGTVVGAAIALGGPALADGRAPGGSHRTNRAAPPPELIIDAPTSGKVGEGAQALGNAFGSQVTIKAAKDESVIGTAYSACVTEEIGTEQDQVFCTIVLKFKDENQIALSAVVPVPHEGVKAQTFDAVVTGGSFVYEGISGSAHFEVRKEGGGYDLTFSG
ncbi:hypothetical protein OHV05_32060 [Kitasatospora sp. NBC_00070]|uniref:hypothetical protein n=1 Tax=Kitasatospora sp. NBC_00070 TaxID=2975962 RepID=UPI0032527CB0